MARKRKKSSGSSASHRQSKQAELTPQARARQVRDLIDKGRFREAVDACKLLLKTERRPEWVELLAEAYRGRARSLADKGMYKEAVTIWRNCSELCGKALDDVSFFDLLCKAGMVEQAFEFYRHHQAALEARGELAQTRERLAALSLAGYDKAIRVLPDDDALVKGYPAAMGALEAYCRGDDGALQESIKAISFRSPFRHFGQILKALQVAESDAAAAAALLERVPKASPFMPLVDAATASLTPDSELFSRLAKQERQARRFIAARWGLDQELLKLAEEVRQLGTAPSVESLIRFVSRHQQLLTPEFARDAAFHLVAHAPGMRSAFSKNFGKLSPLEASRIEAWRCEMAGEHPFDVVTAWERVENALEPSNCGGEPNCRLSVALVVHHCLEYADRFQAPDEVKISALERIIEYDPEDHDAYIRLIAACRRKERLKEARHYVDRAQQVFPEDIAVLTEAVETALASDSYKKAARLAAQILEKDPINIRVRTALIDAHLSHARKQLAQRKYPLADKELTVAEGWTRTPRDKARVDLVRGTGLFAQGYVREAADLWRAAETALGGNICGRFYLLMELARQDYAIDTVLKKAGIAPLATVTKETVLQFIHMLKEHFRDTDAEAVAMAMAPLEKSLAKAATHEYSVADYEMICETLMHCQRDALCDRYAKHARRQHPKAAIFKYYELAVRQAQRGHLSSQDIDCLHDLHDEAYHSGDKALSYRVEQLLNASHGFFDFDDDDEYDDDVYDDGLPVDLEHFIDMLIKALPAQEVKRLQREMGREGLREAAKKMLLDDMEAHFGQAPEDDDVFNPFDSTPKQGKKTGRKAGKKAPDKQLDFF